eukprot:228054_1
MALKLYGVAPSQPTRAIMFLCAMKNYPYEIVKTSPADHTLSKQQFKDNINPSGKIPGISIMDSNNKPFALYESAAIMSYLCSLNNWNDLYPSHENIERRALIDQYNFWHQENTRKVTAGFIRPIMQSSFRKITEWDPYLLVKDRQIGLDALHVIDKYRLKQHKFIVDDELSISDFCCYEEIIQIKEWNFIFNDANIETEKDFPNIYEWIERMRSLPGHDDTHRVIDKLTTWLKDKYDTEYNSLYSRVNMLMKQPS